MSTAKSPSATAGKSRRRQFKTVAGYLRSMEEQLACIQERAKVEGRTPMSEDDGQRQILNNLFFQRGWGRIGINERPIDAVKRLHGEALTAQRAQDIKDLKACLKWLGFQHVARLSFTTEEFAAVERIQRERGLTNIMDAIRIFRAEGAGR
jgi:hypothetical protein